MALVPPGGARIHPALTGPANKGLEPGGVVRVS